MCKYFHSREAYLCQEAASCNVSSHRHCRNTFHGKPYILQYLPLRCDRLQACKGEARSEMQQKCLIDSWREKYNKINNPHKSQKIFTVFFFSALPPKLWKRTQLFSVPSSPIPSKIFLPAIAFKLDCTMWLSSHHLDQPENSLLILIFCLKLEESLSQPSLFLD